MTRAADGLSIHLAETRYKSKYANLYDSLAATACRFPDKAGLRDAETSRTYLQFKTEVDILAGALQETFGLRRGDAVGLLMDNSIDFLRAFYATVKLGCTSVMLNTKQQPEELRRCLEETGARLVLAQTKWRDKIEPCGAGREILYDKAGEGNSIARFLAERETDSGPADPNPPAAVIMFTSGTTGVPKGAAIGHENILQTAYSYEESQGLSSDDVTVLCVPVFHILGLSCVSTLFIYLGATLILEPVFREERILETLSQARATHFHSAPTVYIRLARALEQAGDIRLDSLQICVCGGATIADADRDLFCRYAENASFRIAYGMTETAGGGMLSREHAGRTAPCPGLSAMIADRNMRPVPYGETGQILLRGDIVITGYLNGRGADDFRDGWLCTGDLARMFPDGSIVFQGRSKELINRGGEKVFPVNVEKALLSFPGVEQAAVFGLPDPVYGEVPAAAVVLRSGTAATEEEMRAFLGTRLAKYEIPVRIDMRAEFPCTASGKVAKHLLAAAMRQHNQQQ
jgi:Acyl-CoA synthetases (AMP-forming)/AMP-acid ligases II